MLLIKLSLLLGILNRMCQYLLTRSIIQEEVETMSTMFILWGEIKEEKEKELKSSCIDIEGKGNKTKYILRMLDSYFYFFVFKFDTSSSKSPLYHQVLVKFFSDNLH